eukprot:maker-scaffold591_size129331-snap-gene-0.18 protein:Tk08228 transcript:maker-scaffold591_size129331-snap-gene-0.18-mRNA-1 annotation:"hypothetical protein LOTGIDRAFT_231422"
MVAMGMAPQTTTTTTTSTTTTTRRPIQDIDLAELPEFLKPPVTGGDEKPAPTPIQDIDLPENQEVLSFQPGTDGLFGHDALALNHPEGFGSNEFLSCLLRLHSCEENGIQNCRNVERCKEQGPIFAPIESETDNQDSLGGNPPTADFEICSGVAANPQNYLVPHPEDCTKFFSCQSLGIGRGWIAHLMDCPETTGFDDQLRICNFISVLPRCQKGQSRAFRPYQFLRSFQARQTRTENRLELNLPEYGYLQSNNVTDESGDVNEASTGSKPMNFLVLGCLTLATYRVSWLSML